MLCNIIKSDLVIVIDVDILDSRLHGIIAGFVLRIALGEHALQRVFYDFLEIVLVVCIADAFCIVLLVQQIFRCCLGGIIAAHEVE